MSGFDDPYCFGDSLERHGAWWRESGSEDDEAPVHMKTSIGPFILRAWALASGAALAPFPPPIQWRA